MGTWMQRIAVSWLVYRLTESALVLGLISFVSLIPSLILSPFIGSFVDRRQKYRIVLITQIGLMLQAGVLAALVFFGYYNVWWIGVLSLAQGIINTFDVTARQSDRKSVVEGKRGSVGVSLGGRRIIKKKPLNISTNTPTVAETVPH